MIATGFLFAYAGQAHALYTKPDPIKIIKQIEKDRQQTAHINATDELVADYSEIMDRLITIAAEKYGIVFIVKNENKDFFSSKEG